MGVKLGLSPQEKKHILRVFETRLLRIIFGPNRGKGALKGAL
jgi:hypothetical protein